MHLKTIDLHTWVCSCSICTCSWICVFFFWLFLIQSCFFSVMLRSETRCQTDRSCFLFSCRNSGCNYVSSCIHYTLNSFKHIRYSLKTFLSEGSIKLDLKIKAERDLPIQSLRQIKVTHCPDDEVLDSFCH